MYLIVAGVKGNLTSGHFRAAVDFYVMFQGDIKSHLDRLRAMYSTCDEYHDHGVLTLGITKQSDEALKLYEYKADWRMDFLRKGDFLFEFVEFNHGALGRVKIRLLSCGNEIAVEYPAAKKTHTGLSVRQAVARTTGVSYGLTNIIFSLLMPASIDSHFLEIAGARHSTISYCENNSMIKITGRSDCEEMAITIRSRNAGLVFYDMKLWSNSNLFRHMIAEQSDLGALSGGRVLMQQTSIGFSPVFY